MNKKVCFNILSKPDIQLNSKTDAIMQWYSALIRNWNGKQPVSHSTFWDDQREVKSMTKHLFAKLRAKTQKSQT